MTETPPIKLNCPTCQANLVWSERYPHRPFCSERCKLIDLGEWACENRRIAGDDALPANDDG
jgi:endogenous inhibitor of DNA gyrase (YacG/DUF329 family)